MDSRSRWGNRNVNRKRDLRRWYTTSDIRKSSTVNGYFKTKTRVRWPTSKGQRSSRCVGEYAGQHWSINETVCSSHMHGAGTDIAVCCSSQTMVDSSKGFQRGVSLCVPRKQWEDMDQAPWYSRNEIRWLNRQIGEVTVWTLTST